MNVDKLISDSIKENNTERYVLTPKCCLALALADTYGGEVTDYLESEKFNTCWEKFSDAMVKQGYVTDSD